MWTMPDECARPIYRTSAIRRPGSQGRDRSGGGGSSFLLLWAYCPLVASRQDTCREHLQQGAIALMRCFQVLWRSRLIFGPRFSNGLPQFAFPVWVHAETIRDFPGVCNDYGDKPAPVTTSFCVVENLLLSSQVVSHVVFRGYCFRFIQPRSASLRDHL